MEIKLKTYQDKRSLKRTDVIIEELGIVLKDLSNQGIEYIQNASKTEYIVPLIEILRNNPKFDFRTFSEKMKLEDIVSDKQSKTLLLSREYSNDGNGRQVSRILTQEQADVLKQCLAKNSNYNFLGASDWNHGFDIETFGIEFISKLNDGLDEYTYELLLEDEKLLNEIKNNPQVATYVAKAVNEYKSIQYDMEHYSGSYDADGLGLWTCTTLDSIEGRTIQEKRLEMVRRKREQGKLFCKYNQYEEDKEDLQTLFRERLQQLSDMPRDKIEMFEEYYADEIEMPESKDYNYYEDGNYKFAHWEYGERGEVTIDPETLVEGSVMEYLKTSGTGINVVETDKAFVKKALKTANDLVIKQDEQGKDVTYLQSMLRQRIEGPTNAGSSYENVTEKQLLENLLNANWEETSHPEVMEGCRVFKCNLPGLEGILDLDELDENAELYAIDPKGTGNIGIGAGNVTKKRAQETYLITGKEMIDGIEKDIVFTFHPGEPVKPSKVKAQKVADGTKLTVAKAKKLGLDKAKYLSEDMLQMYREKSEREKPFFKKIFDKLKGVFNRKQKLLPSSSGSLSVHTSQESTKKAFAQEIKLAESELQQNVEVAKSNSIESQEAEK